MRSALRGRFIETLSTHVGVETGLCVTVQLKSNSIAAQKATFAAFSMSSLPQRAPRCLLGFFNTRVYRLFQTHYFSGHSLQSRRWHITVKMPLSGMLLTLPWPTTLMACTRNTVMCCCSTRSLQTQTAVTPCTGIISNSRLFSPLWTSASAFEKLLAYVLRCIFT